ncbi:MAG: hypothetical protein NZM25_06570 [Leptospiraceae bacterium]|nr:hypothetical protein [Leptospiraceae bacterium]MDW8306561.1 hypothetical protein [Leptospiraceae bacterium]
MAQSVLLCCAKRFELPMDFPYPLEEVGVGLFNSLFRLQEVMAEQKPQAVVLLGTGGLLSSTATMEILPGQPFLCCQFTLPPYRHEVLLEHIPSHYRTDGFSPLDRFCRDEYFVYSSFGISTQKDAFVLPPHGVFFVENLEALGLAAFCSQRGIPFYALLSVTNELGPHARKQWEKNHIKAGELLAQWWLAISSSLEVA